MSMRNDYYMKQLVTQMSAAVSAIEAGGGDVNVTNTSFEVVNTPLTNLGNCIDTEANVVQVDSSVYPNIDLAEVQRITMMGGYRSDGGVALNLANDNSRTGCISLDYQGHIHSNLNKVGGFNINTSTGNIGDGTLRTCIAENDVLVSRMANMYDVVPEERNHWRMNLSAVNAQPINVGIGASDVGTQRVALSTDSLQDLQDQINIIKETGFIEKPFSGPYTNCHGFHVGGYHKAVYNDALHFLPMPDDVLADAEFDITNVFPSLNHLLGGRLWVIGLDSADDGKIISVDYWNDAGELHTVTATLIDTSTWSYLAPAAQMAAIQSISCDSPNTGTIKLGCPSSLLAVELLVGFLPANCVYSLTNLTCSIPQNSRYRLEKFSCQCSNQYSSFKIILISYNFTGSVFTWSVLFEVTCDKTQPIVNMDLSFLGWRMGPTDTNINHCITIATQGLDAINLTPTLNSAHLFVQVQW